MENQNNDELNNESVESKIEKVSIKDINKSKEDELVDMIMSKILEIK